METGLAIRQAGVTDAPALSSLLMPVFRAGDTYTIDPDISPDDAVAYWTSPEKTTYLAQRNGQVLGTYYIRPNQGGGGAHVCNCGYITAPEARGQGIARHMLDHSLNEAVLQGYRAMQFNFVASTNTRAIETWKRADFSVVGRLPGAFHHPTEGYVDALVMYRNLR
ncbi:GNAT family N-acetyltransferase [Jannaschia sp. CCS1]|uniref:GNAT family N-acetyltransferase n=1 Tax=Jannaschia sp. (strain CCS1) TaxID=290400 RepID=UPI000053B010|nr:GNAT family N-acetyltransferase [Jannaschia sp. CCS1]ABD52964.1 GCN5-related N-acetyltransferase [Jannaschia sp. CCS1]